ncbi:MAG: aldose 1-epimerase family protein [Clostridia bacterium]|nr:aldose 1-epimerase family protein [Clostridia bacterium]
MNEYIGNPAQMYGAEEVRLVGGKGDGMRLLNVRNGAGLDFTVSLDRCADISRLSYKGVNYGYFAPCGYVSPKYYDNKGAGFLKSFTAGFFTTCGLTAVGTPCTDDGEELPLHGTISNTPCESYAQWVRDGILHIRATVRDAALFAHQLVLEREYCIPLFGDTISMTDTVTNVGSTTAPLEMLYHCNVGYPLLSETARVTIPASEVTPRNAHAAAGLSACLTMEKPQRGYEEMCYYHKMSGRTAASISNESVGRALSIEFDCAELGCFTEWKMMGEHDYVLGLEPGNCYPDGRDVMREKGILEFLEPGAQKTHHLTFRFA